MKGKKMEIRERRKDMKTKRMLLVPTLLLLLIKGTVPAASAYADEAWYACKVIRAGGAWGNGYVRLTDVAEKPAFAEKWFSLQKGEEDVMSTMAMNAMRNGSTICVKADINLGVYPKIGAVHLNPEPRALLHLSEPFNGS
jgi:hypothetical protein